MKITRSIMWKFFPAAFASICLATAAKMDYRDAAELRDALDNLRRSSSHVQVVTIGYSPSIREGRTTGTRYPIQAVRISASTNSNVSDDPDRNGILFECGMHPREWLSTESCLKLAEYLAANAENVPSRVPDLLSKTDVYIIPLTTVAGRRLDDANGGDPEQFSRVPMEQGWRGNGDRRDCEYGTNVARNFSSGWDRNDPGCGSNYPGFAPFSSEEAVALRAFVQNHSISMAVVVHSNAEEIANYWGDAPGETLLGFARWAWRAALDMPELALEQTGRGTGLGQFTAWLAAPSDAAGEPDLGATRSIRTVLVELPILGANYRAPYRDDDRDESNGFHPSSDHVLSLIDHSFIPMARVLIQYAGYPHCAAGAGCPAQDFGLAGAKIGRGYFSAGALESQPAWKAVAKGGETIMPARDYLPTGRYSVYYRVLNFVDAAGDVDVEVTVDDGVAAQRTRRRYSLGRLAGAVDSVAFDVAGQSTEYTITVEVRPAIGFAMGIRDDFRQNDKKVFKFRSYQLD
jgi:hypothetical protein